MAAAPRHLTKTEIALQVLRRRLRSGDLAPGSRLIVEELARELQMSPTPVREALRLLQADGMVDYRAHHGIVVASRKSPDDVRDLFRVRSILEPAAVELAVPLLDDAARSRLERLYEQQVAAVAVGRGASVAELNSSWHWAIYEAAGSPTLNDFVRRLWQAFPWRTMWALPGRPELSLRQHGAIMDAIRSGDAARAAALMREHVEGGIDTLLAQVETELGLAWALA